MMEADFEVSGRRTYRWKRSLEHRYLGQSSVGVRKR